MPKMYKLKNGNYLKIDENAVEEYEYSYYRNDKTLIDGGIIGGKGFIETLVLNEVLKFIFLTPDDAKPEEIEPFEVGE